MFPVWSASSPLPMTVAGVMTSCPPLASGPQLVRVNTVMRVRVLRALSTRGRTAAHSRAQQTTHQHINCCSIHCYSQWESCNRNPGPILQCCMSCSAAVTRDTSVKSAAHHNLQVSVVIRFHKTVKLKEGTRIIKPVTQCQCGGVETYLVSRS